MNVGTDIIPSIALTLIGQAEILVIMFVKTFKPDVIKSEITVFLSLLNVSISWASM